ncbi:MAG: hypothetical protein AABY22_13620 [Nanoarchaeota archaeon]
MLVKYSENMSVTYFSKTRCMVNSFEKRIWYKNEFYYRNIGPSEIHVEKGTVTEVWGCNKIDSNEIHRIDGPAICEYFDDNTTIKHWLYKYYTYSEEEYWNK